MLTAVVDLGAASMRITFCVLCCQASFLFLFTTGLGSPNMRFCKAQREPPAAAASRRLVLRPLLQPLWGFTVWAECVAARLHLTLLPFLPKSIWLLALGLGALAMVS